MRFAPTFVLLATLIARANGQEAAKLYMNPALTPEVRAHDLVSRMTLEEKAAQGLNTAPAIPRLGVPAYDYWSEGLHGVARSGYATLFPQAIGLAATWDAPMLGKIGEVVSTEARAKYNEAVRNNIHSIYFGLTIWSPNINIFRDPRWGRGQETYGEDPFLTGSLGLQFIRGLQGPDPLHPRAVATPKHFAVHSGPESTRHSANVNPSAHDLWETYLPQFRRAIVEGQADSVMCAYNAIYGKPACGSDFLLTTVLRNDWKFNGFVTSDCGAVDDFFEKTAHHYSGDKEHAAADATLSGTDTNCGSTYGALPAAVRQGLLKESELDRNLERLFVARMRLGLFDPSASAPYARIPFSEVRAPQHLALSLRASEESMVLLKNDGILPLKSGNYKRIAVIGPNAASLSAIEGNYNAVPKDPATPIEALRVAFERANVTYSQGSPYADGVALPVPSTMLQEKVDSGLGGLKAEYFADTSGDLAAILKGAPVLTRHDPQIDFDWNSASPAEGLDQQSYAVRWSGFIVPPQPGEYQLSVRLAHCYPCHDNEQITIKVDGKVVNSYTVTASESRESTTPYFFVKFLDDRPHPIEVDYRHNAPLFGGGITLEWVPPADVLQMQAVSAASHADLVIAMVGLSPELEGEEMKLQVPGFAGGDRTDVRLPASQLRMLEDVAAVGKPMVVVLLNGSAISLGDIEQHAAAILESWYPGEFGGKAIADTLLGNNNPAGRLPVTFYKSVEDLPAFDDYSMKNRTYRYFTGKPAYRFGYGLSYTKFEYSALSLSGSTIRAGANLTAEVQVKNIGTVIGDEVAQLYLMPPSSGNQGLSPRLQLEGFQRISLNPGESRKLTFTLSARDLSEVDAKGSRSVQPGTYGIAIGGAQPDDPKAAAAPVTGSFRIVGVEAVAR